jgi:hypothetical protein
MMLFTTLLSFHCCLPGCLPRGRTSTQEQVMYQGRPGVTWRRELA